MQALVRFAQIAAGSVFTTAELYPPVLSALGATDSDYKLGSLRYDLSKLRAKGLVEKLPSSNRYRILPNGYRLSVAYLKLFKRIYAPLAAGLTNPVPADANFHEDKMGKLDRLYTAVVKSLDNLLEAVGLKTAA